MYAIRSYYGDTGDNMVLTIEGCLAELDRLAEESGERSLDEIGREEIVDLVARAALLSARGNSGVILSQLIRGAAEDCSEAQQAGAGIRLRHYAAEPNRITSYNVCYTKLLRQGMFQLQQGTGIRQQPKPLDGCYSPSF